MTTPGLDELKSLHARLGTLLEDAHPGLHTWRDQLSETLLDLSMYAGYGDARSILTAHRIRGRA